MKKLRWVGGYGWVVFANARRHVGDFRWMWREGGLLEGDMVGDRHNLVR